MNREIFIDQYKQYILRDVDKLTYDEFIAKWKYPAFAQVDSKVFEKWQESPKTNWRNSIKNAVILSTLRIPDARMASRCGLSKGTIYHLKLGRLHITDRTMHKLERGLNIKLYNN